MYLRQSSRTARPGAPAKFRQAKLAAMALCSSLAMLTGAFATAATAADTAQGLSFPAKPITIVVGFPPGGVNDRLAREIGDHLSTKLKQPVVIETRPGANGEIAANFVARAKPDGYTLLFSSNGALAVSPSLKSSLPYDPLKDLAPIAVVGENPMVLAVSAKSKYQSLGDLLAAARAKPGALTFASAGTGNPTQLAAELMKFMANVDILHVPYKGGGPALVALEGGYVDFFYGGISNILPPVQSERLRALAITSLARSPQLPDVPTVSESELKGYEATLWYGIMAPANTPDTIVQLLYKNISEIMATPQMRKRLADSGSVPLTLNPDQFQAHLKADTEKWAQVITAASLRQ